MADRRPLMRAAPVVGANQKGEAGLVLIAHLDEEGRDMETLVRDGVQAYLRTPTTTGPAPTPVWALAYWQGWPADPETPDARTMTHEAYIHAVRSLAVDWAIRANREVGFGMVDETTASRLLGAKLVYGKGHGYRGVCHYGAWNQGSDFIEVSAQHEENPVQLAGTTIHETAHVLAGRGAGHDKGWRDACANLGLTVTNSAPAYKSEMFNPDLWARIAALPAPTDGRPTFGLAGLAGLLGFTIPMLKGGGCNAGIGARGGRSRGPGSGSRLRLWECSCARPVKARVASDEFRAHCDACGEPFHLVQKD